MPESMPSEPPTYFANLTTIHVNVDEVTIEFRRLMKPHAELWSLQGKQTPPLTDDDVYRVPVEAKVVLTFVGAKTLLDNLNRILPQFAEMRKQGL